MKLATARYRSKGVLLHRRNGHAMGVSKRCKLARVGKTHAKRRARLISQPAAAQQALEVDDEVKLLSSEAPG
jgi:hypothetical protein